MCEEWCVCEEWCICVQGVCVRSVYSVCDVVCARVLCL